MFLYSYTSSRWAFISIIGWHFYVLYLNCTVPGSLLKERRLIYLVLFPGGNVFMFLKIYVNLNTCILTGGEGIYLGSKLMWTSCVIMLHHPPTTCSSRVPKPGFVSSRAGCPLGPELSCRPSARLVVWLCRRNLCPCPLNTSLRWGSIINNVTKGKIRLTMHNLNSMTF